MIVLRAGDRELVGPRVSAGRYPDDEGRRLRREPEQARVVEGCREAARETGGREIDAVEERRRAADADRQPGGAAGLPVGAPCVHGKVAARPESRDVQQLLVEVVGVGVDIPGVGSEVLERLLALEGRVARPGRLEQGDGAGHVRGRHRGPRHVLVAPRGVRPDALAGGDQVDVAAVVAEVCEGVVLVIGPPRVAAVATEATGLAVRVGQRGDRDHLVV